MQERKLYISSHLGGEEDSSTDTSEDTTHEDDAYIYFNIWDNGDTDNDGLKYHQEAYTFMTDPTNGDTDGDGLGDLVECRWNRYFDPLTPADADDPVWGPEGDLDCDGSVNRFDPIPVDFDMDNDGYINSREIIDPDSPYYEEHINNALSRPEVSSLLKKNQGVYIEDGDIDGDGIPNTQDPDTDGDGMSNDYENSYGMAIGGWQNTIIYNARYAIIWVDTDPDCPEFWMDGRNLHNILVEKYRYNTENIYLLYNSSYSLCDGDASWNDLRFIAMAEIEEKIGINDFFFYSMIGHGLAEGNKKEGKKEPVPNKIWDTFDNGSLDYGDIIGYYINQSFGGDGGIPKKYSRACIVISACYSRYALDDLYGEDRIVISSANYDETAKSSQGGDHVAFFSENGDTIGFNPTLRDSYSSIGEAYIGAWDSCHGWIYDSDPYLEDTDADGNTGHVLSYCQSYDWNNPSKDGYLSWRTYL